METTKEKQPTPIKNFQSALWYLERAHDDLAQAKHELEQSTQKATALFIAARDAALASGQHIPKRFMCGQWLCAFGENGELEVTEIPNSEPFQLVDLARSMGEVDS